MPSVTRVKGKNPHQCLLEEDCCTELRQCVCGGDFKGGITEWERGGEEVEERERGGGVRERGEGIEGGSGRQGGRWRRRWRGKCGREPGGGEERKGERREEEGEGERERGEREDGGEGYGGGEGG